MLRGRINRHTLRSPQSESVRDMLKGYKNELEKKCGVLLKCDCRMAFFKKFLADNLQDDCGGLQTLPVNQNRNLKALTSNLLGIRYLGLVLIAHCQ